MCACVHVCMCACVHVCMCARVHVCMCACVHVCVCMCVCMHAHMRVLVELHAVRQVYVLQETSLRISADNALTSSHRLFGVQGKI